jgi:hypothetical protein
MIESRLDVGATSAQKEGPDFLSEIRAFLNTLELPRNELYFGRPL